MLPIQPLSLFLKLCKGAGKVPWAELERAREEYIKPKYLPKEVPIWQYYHLTQKHVNSILKHWVTRQAAGKIPFLFWDMPKSRKAAKRTAKEASQEDDGDIDMGPGKEAENNVLSNCNSQAKGDGAPQGDCGNNDWTEWAHSAQRLSSASKDPIRVGGS